MVVAIPFPVVIQGHHKEILAFQDFDDLRRVRRSDNGVAQGGAEPGQYGGPGEEPADLGRLPALFPYLAWRFCVPRRSASLVIRGQFHRATLLLTCGGLSDEQRKRRPVATSLMSLHGAPLDNADWERDLPTWQAACDQSRLTSGRPMSLDRCHGLPFEHARGKVDS
jgi:hypothetical protein